MPVSDDIAAYARARDRMFADLVTRLQADHRFVAAWLSGAHGRDEDDEWSDFDFHLAVLDEALEPILADPRPLFDLAGEVLLVQANFPSDSMVEGRFWLVVYPGPIHIDWNIGPASVARRPRASRLLFEKRSVPYADEPPELPAESALADAQRSLEFFWAMAPIAVKYAARGWTGRAVQQTVYLSRAYSALWQFVHAQPLRSRDRYEQNRSPNPDLLAILPAFDRTIDPAEALRVIAEFCGATANLHPSLEAAGVEVSGRVPVEVPRLIALAREQAATGNVSPGSGRHR